MVGKAILTLIVFLSVSMAKADLRTVTASDSLNKGASCSNNLSGDDLTAKTKAGPQVDQKIVPRRDAIPDSVR